MNKYWFFGAVFILSLILVGCQLTTVTVEDKTTKDREIIIIISTKGD